ncbi:histidine kinase [Micromonospora sp. WMMD1082]|uniref:sensor histidine kinase n=1 Tax=Micromonospora sp. WMMD1082 TaxID=3016104 RepID=UPI0024161D3D|nr:histidine kinase [Micromonospora sp. WMMD1082]MDG4796878.1 histidine kinase [Micromonospora sp. WMMD1082]
MAQLTGPRLAGTRPERAQRQAHIGWQDVALAGAALVVDLVLFSRLLSSPESAAGRLPAAILIAYAMVGCAALVWRRRASLLVFGVVWIHSVAAFALSGYRPTVGVLVALYTVAAYRSARLGLAALAAALVPGGLAVAEEVRAAAPHDQLSTAVGVAVFFVLVGLTVWAVGFWRAASRRQALALERRRAAAAREAVAAERARLARELHDIVAHSVTVMVLTAAGAQRVLRTDPDRADQAMGTVAGLGGQAMAELRRMLAVLRPEAPAVGGPDANPPDLVTGPDPGRTDLADLDALLAGPRQAGITVELRHEGVPRGLDGSVGLAAYRVVQEALTNVVKHAGPGTWAVVGLSWLGDRLQVEVTDDGQGRPSTAAAGLSTGHGLLGLRERVAVVGGELSAGPMPDGGFRVCATLPAGPSRPATDELVLVQAGGGDGDPDPAGG